jgi:hypothetical protein
MSTKSKDVWDKLQVTAILAASVLIPFAALIVGNLVSTSQKDSENRVKYVEIAVSILRTDPTESTQALREWAVEILAAQSPVTLSAAVREELKKQQVNLGYSYSLYSDKVDYGSYKNPNTDYVVTTPSKK